MVKVPARIVSLVKLVFFLGVIFGGYYYISSYHKTELNDFYLKFDSWGLTQVGRSEIDRKIAIDALSDKGIPLAQREALKNRTIFLGATDKMVELALGQAEKTSKPNDQSQQVWVYYFDEYTRPTNLYFEKRGNDWVLVKAEKASF